MPTVMRRDGFTFLIYTNDHPPPHVHAFLAGRWCVVLIGDGDTPASIREAGTMRPIDARRAVWMVGASWELLLKRWRMLHGQP